MAILEGQRIVFEVRLRWWLQAYIQIVLTLCELLEREPDWDKMHAMIERGVYARRVER